MSCGFSGSLAIECLRQNYKPYERIKLAEGDFKCNGCGQLGVCQWHVEEIGREA